MAGWLAWSIAAALLAVGEIFTPGMFFLGPVALAAVASAVAAALGGAVWLQLVVFIAGSRRVARAPAPDRPRAPAHARRTPDGTAALEGAPAIVLQRVDRDGGRVRIGGEDWSARAYMGTR